MKAMLTLLLVLTLTACGDSTVDTGPAPHHEVIYTLKNSAFEPLIMRALSDGTGRRKVADGMLVAAPVKGRILFLSPDRRNLYAGSIDGGASVLLDTGSLYGVSYFAMEISPDGQQCLRVDWSKTRSTDPTSLILQRMDRTDRRIVATTLLAGSRASFSPDGRKIAFLGHDYRLYTMNIDGSGLVALTVPPTEVTRDDREMGRAPQWSPDGRWLTMESFDSERIYIVRADGSTPSTLPSVPGRYPSWSPDGKQIACNDFARLVIHTVDGGSRDLLSRPYGPLRNDPKLPYWSPDGRRMIPHIGDTPQLSHLENLDIATGDMITVDTDVANAYWIR